jgi:ubiquitin thioesterase OTU1
MQFKLSGIHYDVVALSMSKNNQRDFDIVVFEEQRYDEIEHAVSRLALILKKKHKYTDLGSFTLKCAVCNTSLIGQKDAQKHALATGHSSFTEYN